MFLAIRICLASGLLVFGGLDRNAVAMADVATLAAAKLGTDGRNIMAQRMNPVGIHRPFQRLCRVWGHFYVGFEGPSNFFCHRGSLGYYLIAMASNPIAMASNLITKS